MIVYYVCHDLRSIWNLWGRPAWPSMAPQSSRFYHQMQMKTWIKWRWSGRSNVCLFALWVYILPHGKPESIWEHLRTRKRMDKGISRILIWSFVPIWAPWYFKDSYGIWWLRRIRSMWSAAWWTEGRKRKGPKQSNHRWWQWWKHVTEFASCLGGGCVFLQFFFETSKPKMGRCHFGFGHLASLKTCCETNEVRTNAASLSNWSCPHSTSSSMKLNGCSAVSLDTVGDQSRIDIHIINQPGDFR